MVTAFNVDTASKKAMFLKEEFSKLGMNIREFISNNMNALGFLKKDDLLHGNEHKVLGLHWNNTQDTIFFRIFSPSVNVVINKQYILSYIASIFDPLGLLSPAILPFKLFFQDLWNLKLKWCDPLSASSLRKWSQLSNTIKSSTFTINRRVSNFSSESCHHKLHAFSDASGVTFSCCVFLRTLYSSSETCESRLIFSKSKVFPIRLKEKLSIHRARFSHRSSCNQFLSFRIT